MKDAYLDAAYDVDPVAFHVPVIACFEPAITECFCSLERALRVVAHHRRSPNLEFA